MALKLSYKYFDITSINQEDWKIIFKFCLEKCNLFNINHILNFELIKNNNSMFLNNNKVKIEELWHFDYNNLRIDEVNTHQELYRYCLDKSDFLYLCVPNSIEIKRFVDRLIDSKIKNNIIIRNDKEYIELSGTIDEYCKKELLSIEFFNALKNIKSEWRYKLFNSFIGYNTFTAVNEYMGLTLNEKDIRYFEEKNILLREKLLSNMIVFGQLDFQLIDLLIDMFSLSIMKPYKKEMPYFTNLSLYSDNMQKLYFSFDELYVCLSELEFNEFKENYQVNTNDWVLIQEKINYQIPADYFSFTLYDMWY